MARDGGGSPVDPGPLPPTEALARAQELLDAGRPFQAHEVLEARWKATAGAQRNLWRGLAQLAVGLTHEGRGNRTGSAALLARAAATLAPYADAAPYDVNVAALCRWAEQAATGRAGPPPPRLRAG